MLRNCDLNDLVEELSECLIPGYKKDAEEMHLLAMLCVKGLGFLGKLDLSGHMWLILFLILNLGHPDSS